MSELPAMIQYFLSINYIRAADHCYQCPALIRILEDVLDYKEPLTEEEIIANVGVCPTMGYAYRPVSFADFPQDREKTDVQMAQTEDGSPFYQFPGLVMACYYRFLEMKHVLREEHLRRESGNKWPELVQRNQTPPLPFSQVAEMVAGAEGGLPPNSTGHPAEPSNARTQTWYEKLTALDKSAQPSGLPTWSPLSNTTEWTMGHTDLTSEQMTNIKMIASKYRGALYANSHGTSVSSTASEAEVARSRTAQIFKTADDNANTHRFREFPGENFDADQWAAECVAVRQPQHWLGAAAILHNARKAAVVSEAQHVHTRAPLGGQLVHKEPRVRRAAEHFRGWSGERATGSDRGAPCDDLQVRRPTNCCMLHLLLHI